MFRSVTLSISKCLKFFCPARLTALSSPPLHLLILLLPYLLIPSRSPLSLQPNRRYAIIIIIIIIITFTPPSDFHIVHSPFHRLSIYYIRPHLSKVDQSHGRRVHSFHTEPVTHQITVDNHSRHNHSRHNHSRHQRNCLLPSHYHCNIVNKRIIASYRNF